MKESNPNERSNQMASILDPVVLNASKLSLLESKACFLQSSRFVHS